MYFLSLKNEKEVIFILFVWLLIISSYFFYGIKGKTVDCYICLGIKKDGCIVLGAVKWQGLGEEKFKREIY